MSVPDKVSVAPEVAGRAAIAAGVSHLADEALAVDDALICPSPSVKLVLVSCATTDAAGAPELREVGGSKSISPIPAMTAPTPIANMAALDPSRVIATTPRAGPTEYESSTDIESQHAKDLGQLGRRLVALQGFECDLRLAIRLELFPSGCHEHLQDVSVLNLKSVSSFRVHFMAG